MTPPSDLWGFEGHWLLSRIIDDALAGRVVRASGQAALRRGGPGLVYEEQVTLHLPGQAPIPGTRRYLWRAEPDGIAVQFEDGRAFHSIALGAAQPEAAHWCDPDQYDVCYDFAAWPRWTSRWQVRGPRKSYVMTTRYDRAPRT